MRTFALTLSALLVLLVAPAVRGGPLDGVQWVPSLTEAMKQAKERGADIFIAMTIDGEQSNEAQKAQFQDAAFIKASRDFVCVYANPMASQTIEVEVDGKRVRRLKDAPTITPNDARKSWNEVRKNYTRNVASNGDTKIPYQFVIDANGEFVGEAVNGTVEGGFDVVPAEVLVKWLSTIVSQRGKGLTEKEYRKLKGKLADAEKAKTQNELKKALKLLQEVREANQRSALADRARKLIDEISAGAQSKLDEALAKVEEDPIAAMIALEKVAEAYPGTEVAETARARIAELKGRKDVKKRLREIETTKRAMGEIAQAEELVKAEEYVKAIAMLKKIARKYKDLPVGKQAADRAEELSNDEAIAKKIAAAEAEKFSRRVLSMGRNYAKNGMKDKAIREFQKILDRYPDTPWAEEAKKEIEKLK